MDMKKSVRLSDAAAIAGIEVGQLRNWIQREQIIIVEPDHIPAAERGSYGLVTARGVLRIAITAKLAQIGMPVRKACEAAMHFVDGGTERRMPGRLFPEGKTALLIKGSNGNVQLINVQRETDFVNDVFYDNDTEMTGAIILPLNNLVWHIEQEILKL